MSTIYAFVNGRWSTGDLAAVAVAEDGTFLASHISSSEGWAKHDIGVTSDWQHEHYAEHYPDGFTVEWVDDPKAHEGVRRAFDLNRAQAETEAEA